MGHTNIPHRDLRTTNGDYIHAGSGESNGKQTAALIWAELRTPGTRNTVFRLVLLGFNAAEAARLSRSIAGADAEIEVVRVDGGRIDPARAGEIDAAIVAPDGDGRLPGRVQAAREAGLPVVVMLPGHDLAGLDATVPQLDFCLPPHAPGELALRAKIVASRSGRQRASTSVQVGELTVDTDRYEVRVSGQKVDLTYKEYELLRVLASNPGRVFSREVLLRTVWEYDYFGGTRTVDVHIRRLRSKIQDAKHRFIETVWNVGYRFRSPDQPPQEETATNL
jgi:DNA-binding response OmpR family regulator